MIYSVYNNTLYIKELASENGLYKALVLLGASRIDTVQSCPAYTRFDVLKRYYFENEDSFRLCNRGIKYVCSILRKEGISVRKRKCMNYVLTKKGKWFYTDTSIIPFSKALIQTISDDETQLRLLHEILFLECNNFSNNIGKPILEDCVQHIFGFQYECLSKIVSNRAFPNSRKSKALKECLNNFDEILKNLGFPKCT